MRSFTPYEEIPVVATLLLLLAACVGELCLLFSLSVPVSTLLAFGVSLLACHAWFWFFQKRHGAEIPKYIDYVYLSVGALGLFASIIGYTNDRFDRRQRDAVDRVIAQLSDLREAYGKAYSRDCLNLQLPSVGGPVIVKVDAPKCAGLKQLLETYDVDGTLRADASYMLLAMRIKAVREIGAYIDGVYAESEKVFAKYMPLTVTSGVDFVWLPPRLLELMRYIRPGSSSNQSPPKVSAKRECARFRAAHDARNSLPRKLAFRKP
jgi:hypothetical protein